MKSIKIKTPAKINLTLEILNKREDGFHNIQSIMQTVSLYDFIEISAEEGNGIKLSGNSNEIPYNNSNLCYKAAELFLKETKIKSLLKINIKKNIPVSAGLAGGSTNAAGVLYGLNELFNQPLSRESLHKLASKLGSDVNFCLEGGTKIAEGRGEILRETEDIPEINLVIVKPKNVAISAKEAYVTYAKLKNKPQSIKTQEILKDSKNKENIIKNLNNHLEEAVKVLYPEVTELKKYLIERGCLSSLMSGSGSSVFGIYEGEIPSIDLPENEYDIFYVKTTNHGVSIVKP